MLTKILKDSDASVDRDIMIPEILDGGRSPTAFRTVMTVEECIYQANFSYHSHHSQANF